MQAAHKNRRTFILAFLFSLALICLGNAALAQTNYTVGDGYGNDHRAYIYAPFFWEGNSGEEDYLNHVCTDVGGTCGQQYEEESDCLEIWPPGYWPPNYGPVYCFLDDFGDFISNSVGDLGVLMASTHGGDNIICVEAYANSEEGKNARDDAYNTYLWAGYSSSEIDYGRTTTGYYTIDITDYFIRNYGNLSQGLVFVNTCYGGTLVDDFVNYANARAAVGFPGDVTYSQAQAACNTFFRRMDGQEGLAKRPASAAAQGLNFTTGGALNTTLAPAVSSVSHPSPLRINDVITVRLDTKCDTWIDPYLSSNWCDLDSVRWTDSSTIRAIVARIPTGLYESRFYLYWGTTWSARNWSRLDGNTDPPGGANAQGPAHDDYEWTASVVPCNCGATTTLKMWADCNADGTLNGVDVVRLTNYVYKAQLTQLVAPAGVIYPNIPPPGPNPNPTCPIKLGDANWDGLVNATDVVRYVNFVYKTQLTQICNNPCSGSCQ